MPGNNQVLGSFRTVKVLSPTTVIDVEYVTVQTIPHGLGWAYAIPLDEWRQGGAGLTVLSAISAELENLYTYEHVVAAAPVLDVDLNGLLVDMVSLTVEYSRTAQGLPPLYGTVDIPIRLFVLLYAEEGIPVPSGTVTPPQLVGAEYDRLAALAGP